MFDILKKLPQTSTWINNMIKDIENKGVLDKSVLKAMAEVPRHLFVPLDMKLRSYLDSALPIGHSQTISQPYIVAYMTAALALKPEDRVLEVGTGSGYQTAILAKLCKHVYSVELNSILSDRAASNLNKLQIKNVSLYVKDGYEGLSENAPYDAIIVTAAPDHFPTTLIEQLGQGGRMVIPVGPCLEDETDENYQWLYSVGKKNDELFKKRLIAVRFVPMVKDPDFAD